MGDTESELVISCRQARFPETVLDCIRLSCWSRVPCGDFPKQPRLMLGQRVALCKLTVGPFAKDNSTQLIKRGEVELVLV